ncbi:HEPN domain-containing protein [bacterium]|nr:HEPN domain-containing protein [bacterium]
MTGKYSLASKLRTMLDKAIEDIDLALKIINGGPCRVASSRAYYATFYAMEAALLSKGLLRSKHGGVISAFNQYFVKTGILPSHFGALISNLFSCRNVADYEFESTIDESEAKRHIQAAQEIVGAITEHLIKEGFIDASGVGD